MAEYTYDQLKDMKVAELREIAKALEGEPIQGYSTMHKEQLLPALCKVLKIEVHHVAVGSEKARIKAALRKLKASRDQALAARDHAKLAHIRQQIHAMKRRLHRMVQDVA